MNKQRYVLAVYLFLAAISVILGLVALNYYIEGSPLQSLILNLSTEIAGAVLIFFIVNQLFLIGRDNELSKEIARLTDSVKDKFSPYVAFDGDYAGFIIDQLQQNPQQVDLLGYNLVGTLRKTKDSLAEAVKRGVRVRVLIVDMHGETANILSKHTEKPQMMIDDYRNALDFAKEIEDIISKSTTPKGSFQVRLTSWIPSCAMAIFHRTSGQGIAQISIHSPSFRSSTRLRKVLFFAESTYTDDYTYFMQQFAALWEEDSYTMN